MGRVLKLLLAFALLSGAVVYGFLIHAQQIPPYRTLDKVLYHARENPTFRGLFRWASRRSDLDVWNPVDPVAPPQTSLASQEELDRLRAIGYLSGYEPATAFAGVTIRTASAYPGLNLYNSGHAPEAFLTDMDGKVLHRWRMDFFGSAFTDTDQPAPPTTRHWRRIHLFENGNLLAIYEGQGLIMIDRDSNLLWARNNGSHHDVQVLESGEIWVLTRIAHVNPKVHAWKPILEDYVTALSPDGNEIASFSILEAFQNSHFAPFLRYMPESGDIFHTNALQVLDGSHEHQSPAFRRGNVLLSLNDLSLIAIMDIEKVEVVWVFAGMTHHQHDSEFLDNGNILMFDNEGHRGFSKVVEIDPLTQEIVWGYFGDEGNGFLTKASGTNQRLPNGNTLITESIAGRAFEVDVDGQIVWEFHNPHRAGDADELVATLFELQRIAPDFPTDWMAAESTQEDLRETGATAEPTSVRGQSSESAAMELLR